MKLTLAEPKYLKDSVAIISELVNEATFKITNNAIELVAMDPANVAMVIFKLLNSCFVEYDVKENVEIAINLNNLKQILKRAKPNDMLTLQIDSNSKLQITLKSNTTRVFNLPIIELDEKEQKVPDLNFSSIITTDASILGDAIEDAYTVAESVSFIIDSGNFRVEAEGDMSKVKIDIHNGEETKVTGENARSKFSIEYLKKMMIASKISDTVSLHLSTDYPLKLEYKVIDKLMMAFILAPRVEND